MCQECLVVSNELQTIQAIFRINFITVNTAVAFMALYSTMGVGDAY